MWDDDQVTVGCRQHVHADPVDLLDPLGGQHLFGGSGADDAAVVHHRDAVGAGRTAVRLSPNGEVNGVIDSDPEALFAYVARELDKIGLAFLELREGRPNSGFTDSGQPPVSPLIRRNFTGVLVLNGDYTPDEAAQVVAQGKADAISFGRLFIVNPDLPARIRQGLPLTEPVAGPTWYSQGDEGYVDYPPHEAALA